MGPHELVTFAAECLADFKVPQYLVVRPEPLPKNPAGKVLKALFARADPVGKAAPLSGAGRPAPIPEEQRRAVQARAWRGPR